MKIVQKITDLIGHTPLLELTHTEQEEQLQATLLGKLEYFNPAGSVKDRIAKAMIDEAEEQGLLHCSCKRLSSDYHHAGNDECRTSKPDESIRCRTGADGGCKGHERCD